jgi:hypothetical protein
MRYWLITVMPSTLTKVPLSWICKAKTPFHALEEYQSSYPNAFIILASEVDKSTYLDYEELEEQK